MKKKTARREIIPELNEQKWAGYTETLRLPEEDRGKFEEVYRARILYYLNDGSEYQLQKLQLNAS